MNPDDIAALAKEIYTRAASHNPSYWDKQKIARQSIEWATQFFLALHYEKEGIVYSSDVTPRTIPPTVLPTASTGTPMYSGLPSQSEEQHMTVGNQQASGRGKVTQLHSGLGMG